MATPKVFRDGEFVCAFSGLLRAGQVVRYVFDAPPMPHASDERGMDRYMAGTWASGLRETMLAEGVQGQQAETSDFELLVGVRGRLYVVEGDYAVWRCARRYHAAGSGAEFALGAIHALRSGRPKLTPTAIIQCAIASACEHANTVRGPVTVVEAP